MIRRGLKHSEKNIVKVTLCAQSVRIISLKSDKDDKKVVDRNVRLKISNARCMKYRMFASVFSIVFDRNIKQVNDFIIYLGYRAQKGFFIIVFSPTNHNYTFIKIINRMFAVDMKIPLKYF